MHAYFKVHLSMLLISPGTACASTDISPQQTPVIDMRSPAHAPDKAAQSLAQAKAQHSNCPETPCKIIASQWSYAYSGQGCTFRGRTACLCCPSKRTFCAMTGAETRFIVPCGIACIERSCIAIPYGKRTLPAHRLADLRPIFPSQTWQRCNKALNSSFFFSQSA